MKIAAVVVTYNRKDLLLKCLKGIEMQDFKPSVVYVVDNSSTDGTQNMVNDLKLSIPIKYMYLSKNMGSAGGFYNGLKEAYSTCLYDGYWVLDDDGIPDKSCLNNLIKYLDEYAYIAPLVLSIEDPYSLAFPYLKEKTLEQVKKKYGVNGVIKNYANPFNGILYRNDLIAKIGFPKQDMFIWGDENEYDLRAKYNNFESLTVVNAIHFHPKERMVMYKDIFRLRPVIYVDSELKRYCKYRNSVYVLKKYNNIFSIMYFFLRYMYFYLFDKKMDIKGFLLFLSAFKDGFMEDFTKHYRYM